MAGFSLSRNPTVAKAINWAAFGVGGALFFSNIHFSARAMQTLAASGQSISMPGGGTLSFSPAVAGDDLMGLFSRYVTALSVSLICSVVVGCFLHPAGLPQVFYELRNIVSGGGAKVLSLIVTCAVLALLGFAGFYCYRYDLATTQLAFNAPLWGVGAVPVWVNVFGTEIFMHATHFYGQLQGGKQKPQPQSPQIDPAMAAALQGEAQKGGWWKLK